jgi:glycosyltransferase involved in cell wall biosynthesis
MKIAIVGPAHPYKGGIVQETTELAHRLAALGHEVELVAWKSQYPRRLYPGTMLPDDQPEQAVFPNTSRQLSWSNPLSWRAVGKRLRAYDQVIFVWWLPTLQAPIYQIILGQLKGVRASVICHNVLPHEGRPGDKQLAQRFFQKVDHLIVHSPEQAAMATDLTTARISTVELPPLLPGWSAGVVTKHDKPQQRLLFFGIVRDYKGLDVLLEAIAKVPSVQLTVAGEFWGGTEQYSRMIDRLGIGDRVKLHAGYIDNETIPKLFAAADALVLPYRSATGTTNVRLGFAYNLPVIASDVPALAEQINDGVDGLLFPSGDADGLAAAIKQSYQPITYKYLHHNLPEIAVDQSWQDYIKILVS